MTVQMTQTKFRSIVEPIINEASEMAAKNVRVEWPSVFKKRTDVIQRDYHEEAILAAFGAAELVPEGQNIPYLSGGTYITPKYYYQPYGLAFALSELVIENSKHLDLAQMFGEGATVSLMEAREVNCANVFNRAFNSSYTMPSGDGQPLLSASHTFSAGTGGTWSNLLSTSAALSTTSLASMLIQIRTQGYDFSRNYHVYVPETLVVPPSLEYQAKIITNSTLVPGGANNDVNIVGQQIKNVAVMTRLTSSTNWFVKVEDSSLTAVNKGLQMMVRWFERFGQDGDFDTGAMRYKKGDYYAVGWTDPHTLWGTPGV